MSKYRCFTLEQETILTTVSGYHPLVWRQNVTASIAAALSLSELHALRSSLQSDHQKLQQMLAALPPEVQIASYISDVPMYPDVNRSYRVARVIDTDVNRNLDLPGADIEDAIRAQYVVLTQLLEAARDLFIMLNERISGMHHDEALSAEVLEAINDIPLTTPEERESICEALTTRRGKLLLREHPKKDASLIVDHLGKLCALYASPLTSEERREITIECSGETFLWFGDDRSGNRQRDQAKHVASQQTTKPSPRVAGWLARHTL